eukprot:48207-Amphidinium_carterae.1
MDEGVRAGRTSPPVPWETPFMDMVMKDVPISILLPGVADGGSVSGPPCEGPLRVRCGIHMSLQFSGRGSEQRLIDTAVWAQVRVLGRARCSAQ